MAKTGKTNHLSKEPSPYLQQHASNPVDWYPWGKKALEKAKKENKPILLSIGYAACHWCHVMAHESFEDEKTAEIMNKFFINIKVDKEERPDLDKIYQITHYFLSQRGGGWPLTVFLTSDLVPFFSGTYFPKVEHHQLPAFSKILETIADLYQAKQDEIRSQNLELKKILEQRNTLSGGVLNHQPLQLGLDTLERHYDPVYGGFGGAPKFPQASKLEFLLWHKSPLALATLMQMARGGIYDQLAGGFYRYSVDEKWNIPHFEKMLYDNGQLLTVYSLASQQYAEPCFAEIVRETAEWVIEEMQATEGGYYSSLDADSEGEEGKFYRWDRAEVEALLTPDEYALVQAYYGLNKEPNFEGHWHFYVAHPLEQAKAGALLAAAKKKLLKVRNKRVCPFRDEKILTSWNGLMIKGMFLAGQILWEPRFIDSAERALEFVHQKLWKKKHLLASYKDGKAYLSAYLDDYVFLLDALVTALQINWNTKHLQFAITIVEQILTLFADENAGGFYFTAKNHEQLLFRPKTMMDEAIPASNGILVKALLILGSLLAEPRYLMIAEKTLEAFSMLLMQYPAEHCSLLQGLKTYLKPPPIIVLRGDKEEIKAWQHEIQGLDNYIFAIPSDTKLPKALAAKKIQGNSCAYLCRGTHCEAVVTDKEKLKTLLSEPG